MVVDLCQVSNSCSARCWESEVALLINQEGDKVGKPLLKAHSKLESVKYYGMFFIFGQQNMIGS